MKIIDRKFLKTITPTCHASTLAYYKEQPVFAWFGGEKEGLPDSAIFIQTQQNKDLCSIGLDNIVARWNPILMPYEDKLFLFVKYGEFCDRWQTSLYDITLMVDKDAKPLKRQLIPAGLNGPVKTKVIIDKDTGLIYCGSSVETRYDWTSYIEVYKFAKDYTFEYQYRTEPLVVPKVEYSTLWGGVRLSNGIIQPSLWVDNKDNIHAFFRSSTGLGKIFYSKSKLVKDGDFSKFKWSNPVPIDHLDNPNSGMDTLYLNDKLYLVYNPSSLDRAPLVLAELNQDDNFKIVDTLEITKEIKPEEMTYSPELSYPYMIESKGNIEITYTYGRTRIEHVRIKP